MALGQKGLSSSELSPFFVPLPHPSISLLESPNRHFAYQQAELAVLDYRE